MTLLNGKYLFRSIFIIEKTYVESTNIHIFTVIGEPEKLTLDRFIHDLDDENSLIVRNRNPYITLLNEAYAANIAEVPLYMFNVKIPPELKNFPVLDIDNTPDFDDLDAVNLWIELNKKKI